MKPGFDSPQDHPATLKLQLFVSGMSPKSMEAVDNIRKICSDTTVEIEIIDIYKNPERATEQHIVFSPSLIRLSPLPKKTLIGTLSDTEKVKKILGIP